MQYLNPLRKPFMRANRLIPIAALAFAAACSEDTATNPTSVDRPQFVTVFNGSTAPSGAHYASGFGEPTCTINDLTVDTVTCTGTKIGGIGGTDATVSITVSYSATVQCRNKGGNIVEVKTQTSTTTTAPENATEVRNGQLTVSSVSSTAPSTQSFLNAADCPNGNWDKLLVAGSPSVTDFLYTLTFDGFTAAAISVAAT
jgi:hypothetical protein